jgi:transcriptional regulator with XRE-family HTH domain
MENYFKKNLLFLREKKGETQAETATALGLTRSTLANYEQGVNEPKLVVLCKIIGHFGVTFEQLMFLDLRHVHLTEKSGLEKNAESVHLNVHPNVHLKTKSTNFEEEALYRHLLAQFSARIEALEANLAYHPQRLLIAEAKLHALCRFLAQALSPLVYTTEEAATAALNNFLNEEVKQVLKGNPA